MTTLSDAVYGRDNDYRPITARFTARTGLGWHDLTPASTAVGTRLSVVIPAHNSAYSLTTVLDALAGQDTSGNAEIIVIDDASTDDTTAIAAEHPAVDLAYRLPVNVGPAAARNLGTYLSEAATVVYLDADMVLPPHVLADIAVRAHPELVLVGFRHNVAYQPSGDRHAAVPDTEPDLEADHRVLWNAPAHAPMFYSGQIYTEPVTGRPLDDTDEFVDLGNGATYYDWDLPRMVVTALVAAPRAAVFDVGGFDPGFTATGWGSEDTYLGAALIAAGCKIAPLRQARGHHIDPPDAQAQWAAKLSTAHTRVAHYRALLGGPVPQGLTADLTNRAQNLLDHAKALR